MLMEYFNLRKDNSAHILRSIHKHTFVVMSALSTLYRETISKCLNKSYMF